MRVGGRRIMAGKGYTQDVENERTIYRAEKVESFIKNHQFP